MKTPVLLMIAILLFSCTVSRKPHDECCHATEQIDRIIHPEFQSILDSAGVTGSILIFDSRKGEYYSNDFNRAGKSQLPASTFKIPHSIIALESGVVEDDNTLFPWDGKPRWLKTWEQDLNFNEAFHLSCVPCYQEIARTIGEVRMNEYLNKIEYGDMQVDSSNIDMFWLEGSSRIDQIQQIDFLKRFYKAQLPISERTQRIARRLFIIESNETFTLSGKTGLSNTNGNRNGWYIGYIETGDNVYFFATNIDPVGEYNMQKFIKARIDVTERALKGINAI